MTVLLKCELAGNTQGWPDTPEGIIPAFFKVVECRKDLRLERKVKNLAGEIFFSPELTDPARDKTAVNIGRWTGDQEQHSTGIPVVC